MVGKLTTVLAKKEAEAYCAQGLHQEAVNLFSKLLASAKKMDPAIQDAIKVQIQGIRQEMQDTHTQDHPRLTPEEIRCIRDGWGNQATETDTLVCAQAFYQMGSYDEALLELKKLLGSRTAKRIHITAAADCLVRLHLPEQIPEAAEALVRELFSENRNIWAALVVMAKHMETAGHKDHALALFRHMALVPELSKALQPRIEALSEAAPTPPAMTEKPPQAPAPPPSASRRSGLGWLTNLFRKRPK